MPVFARHNLHKARSCFSSDGQPAGPIGGGPALRWAGLAAALGPEGSSASVTKVSSKVFLGAISRTLRLTDATSGI